MSPFRSRALRILLPVAALWLAPAAIQAQEEDDDPLFDDDDDDEEGEGDEKKDDDGPDSGDPNITREDDGEDVDEWSFEGEKVEQKEEKEEKVKVGRELQPEPKRYGNSGNWYEVNVRCGSCRTLLGQELNIEDSDVLRQFYDFIQIDSNRKGGKFVYPSVGENRPVGVKDFGNRVVIWMYVVDTGSRLTDTYATVWDFEVKANKTLLYGRRYELQAWTDAAYEEAGSGYRAKTSFVPVDKLLKYVDLTPVKNLTTEKKNFPVGEDSRITFSGYGAFARHDVDRAAITKEQEDLKAAEEAEKKRVADQKRWFEKGEGYRDDRAWEDAVLAYSKARELGLATADLNYGLGVSLHRLKKYEEAIVEYRAVLDADPRDTDVRYNLAKIYEGKKDFDSAIREYQTILKFDPDDDGVRDRVELLKAARDMAGG